MKYFKVLSVILSIILISAVCIFTPPFVIDETSDDESLDIAPTLSSQEREDFINKLFFVGDSTTYHFYKGGIELSHIIVPESKTLKLTSDILQIAVNDEGDTIPDAIARARAETVILTIGVNGADSFTEKQYKTYYKKLILGIREKSPDTRLILQSVFPVTAWYSDLALGITNEGIDRVNTWGRELAAELDIYYLDTQSILKDDCGGQMLIYGENDGVHINAWGYEKIIEYIADHAMDLR